MKEPKIRFKGFQGEWGETKFDSLAKIRRGLTYSPSNITAKGVRVLRSSNINEDTFITSEEDVFVEEGCVNIPLANDGDILITAANGSPRLVGKHTVIETNGSKMVPGGFMVLAMTDEPYFLNTCMSSPWYKKFLKTGVAGGNGAIGNLNKIALSESMFYIPTDKVERDSLASYFQQLDALIQSTTKKIESLKQVKAASLQSMFPQEGETTPRVRFKGFEGEWEETLLGTIFSERCEYRPNAEMLSVTMNQGVIKASDNGRFDNSNSDKSKYKLVKVDDIAYNSMRMWQGACGCSKYEGIVSPAYTVIVPKEDICPSFFSYMFKTNGMLKVFRLNSQGLTSDTWNLKYPAFSKLSIIYPKVIAEQRAIASYFTNLDRQITLQSQRLEKLKQIKAACLDKMFV